jgi:beta-glucosidase
MKRKLFYVSGLAMMLMASCAPKVAPAIPQDKEIESRVESILKDMTLEEKVGQMTQITITALADGTELTQAGDSIMRTYKVGSVLNTPEDMAQAPEEYNRLICQLNRISMETTGIPCLYGLDHVHGTTYIAGGTLFPQELSLAA